MNSATLEQKWRCSLLVGGRTVSQSSAFCVTDGWRGGILTVRGASGRAAAGRGANADGRGCSGRSRGVELSDAAAHALALPLESGAPLTKGRSAVAATWPLCESEAGREGAGDGHAEAETQAGAVGPSVSGTAPGSAPPHSPSATTTTVTGTGPAAARPPPGRRCDPLRLCWDRDRD